jgi:molybdopterin-synthase adenylyltransferase
MFTEFTEHQTERYLRQIILNEFGPQGQSRLLKARILVIGAGGLGSPALMYLAAAGIGTIGIADFDRVELSNLHRQIVHTEADIGGKKTDSVYRALKKINSETTVICHDEEISFSNATKILGDYDFIIHATDKLSTKIFLNDACVLSNKPFSHAGVVEFGGQILTVIPHISACLRCIFGKSSPDEKERSCAEDGILGPIAGVLGTLQALEAIKFITDTGKLLTDTIMFFDGKTMEFRKIKTKKNIICPVCGEKPSIISPVKAI